MKGRVPHLAAALLVAIAYAAGGLEVLERHLMDARFRILKHSASGKVAVVTIDPASLQRLGVWPWPRGYHATVVENLIAAGARTVAFDVDFSSRSIPEEDRAFAEAIEAASPRVVLPVFQQFQPGLDGSSVRFGTAPLPELAASARLAGINVRPEPDGLVRRARMMESGPEGPVASLPATIATGAGSLEDFYIDYGIRPESVTRISYADVLTGLFDPRVVGGKEVIVGATAIQLGDQIPVPVHTILPGPILQAIAAETLILNRPLYRSPVWIGVVGVLLAGLLAGPWIGGASWRGGAVTASCCAAGLFVLSCVVQAVSPLMIDVSPMALGCAGFWTIGLVRSLDQQNLRLLLQAVSMRGTETRMRHVVENSIEGIVTVGEDGRIESFNPAATAIFGLTEEAAVGQPFSRLFCDTTGMPASVETGASQAAYEAIGMRRDGTTFPIEMTDTRFTTEGRPLRVAFMRDITLRKSQQEALEHQATHDVLTGLPNRVMLKTRIDELLARGRGAETPMAFLILDLDRFKEVNDTLGHQVGDRLLQQIAERLREPLRACDTIARLGGDEFAILLPDTTLAEAQSIASGFIGSLAHSFELDGLILQVDASIGIAMYPDHGTEATTLLQRGDVAMYVAKRARNTFAVYSPEEDFNSVRHLTLKGELRQAVEENHLVLYYQPKISSTTGRVEGAEALMRWQHPKHGLVPPSEFIPLAEYTGLIKPMTHWVLEAAIRQCAQWQAMGIDLPISVNCSARNLLEEDLPGTIQSKLTAHGVAPERLVLEITETAIIEDPQGALEGPHDAGRARRADLDRRLRDRLLVARISHQAAGNRAEDRPVVRDGDGQGQEQRRRRPLDDRPGAQPRDEGRRRRGGLRAGLGAAPHARVRHEPGVSLLASRVGAGLRLLAGAVELGAEDARARGGDRDGPRLSLHSLRAFLPSARPYPPPLPAPRHPCAPISSAHGSRGRPHRRREGSPHRDAAGAASGDRDRPSRHGSPARRASAGRRARGARPASSRDSRPGAAESRERRAP